MARMQPVLFLLLLLVPLPGCGKSADPTPVNLGHVGVLTGPDRAADEDAARGLRLALMDKDIGAVDGHPLIIRHTDTRGQLDAYEAQAVRLAYVSKASILFGGDTGAQVARLDRAGLPVLSPCGFRPPGVSDKVFLCGLDPATQAQALARFAVDRLSLAALLPEGRVPMPSVILRDEASDEADAFTRAFLRAWDAAWAKRADAVPTPSVVVFGKEKNWPDIAAKALKEKPLCVVFAGNATDFQAFASRLPDSIPLILHGGTDASLADAPPGLTVRRATAFAADAPGDGIRTFVKKYRDAFGADAGPSAQAAVAYDSLRILVHAMKQAIANGTTTAAELRQLKDFAGITGPLSFTANQTLRRPAFIVRQRGAAAHFESRVEPE